eukprot:EG_transcript_30602
MLLLLWLAALLAEAWTAAGAATVSVAADTMDPGVQASQWVLTVQDLSPASGGVFYISSSVSTFLRRPASTPDLIVAGCTATCTSTLTSSLYFSLPSSCSYSGTFSFVLPGAYLAVNPSGTVRVTLSLGDDMMRVNINFALGPPSPSRSPVPSESPSPSPIASPSLSVSPTSIPAPSPSPTSASPSLSPLPTIPPSPSPSPTSPS